jgi:glucose dehydrogenase
MILLTILAITLLFLAIFTILAVSLGGSIFIIVFGDVIVCMLVLIWLMKRLMKR